MYTVLLAAAAPHGPVRHVRRGRVLVALAALHGWPLLFGAGGAHGRSERFVEARAARPNSHEQDTKNDVFQEKARDRQIRVHYTLTEQPRSKRMTDRKMQECRDVATDCKSAIYCRDAVPSLSLSGSFGTACVKRIEWLRPAIFDARVSTQMLPYNTTNDRRWKENPFSLFVHSVFVTSQENGRRERKIRSETIQGHCSRNVE